MGFYCKSRAVCEALKSASGLGASAKWVLVAIADYASDRTGRCCPSIMAIVDKSGLSRATVFRALKDLADAGIVVIGKEDHPGGWKHNTYEIRTAARSGRRSAARRYCAGGRSQKDTRTNIYSNTLSCVSVYTVQGKGRNRPNDPLIPGLRGYERGDDPTFTRDPDRSLWMFTPVYHPMEGRNIREEYPLNAVGERMMAEDAVSCALAVVGETHNRVTRNALVRRFRRLGRNPFEAEVRRIAADLSSEGSGGIRNAGRTLLWRLDKVEVFQLATDGYREDFDLDRLWDAAEAMSWKRAEGMCA